MAKQECSAAPAAEEEPSTLGYFLLAWMIPPLLPLFSFMTARLPEKSNPIWDPCLGPVPAFSRSQLCPSQAAPATGGPGGVGAEGKLLQ